MQKEEVVWGIHAGRTGDAESLFLKHSCIAVGWSEVGDLSGLNADREAFKARLKESRPGIKAGAIPVEAGQLFRFVYEMQPGDLVVYPSKHSREIHIGRVEGPYFYDPRLSSGYPNLRKVKWLRNLPRIHFSQGALYEIGCSMSLFQIRNYADEFRAAVRGELSTSDESPTGPSSEEIEQLTRDFVLKRLAQELKGHELSFYRSSAGKDGLPYARITPRAGCGH